MYISFNILFLKIKNLNIFLHTIIVVCFNSVCPFEWNKKNPNYHKAPCRIHYVHDIDPPTPPMAVRSPKIRTPLTPFPQNAVRQVYLCLPSIPPSFKYEKSTMVYNEIVKDTYFLVNLF